MNDTSITLMRKRIDLAASPVLFDEPFSERALSDEWDIRGGEWVLEDRWLSGRNPGNFPGMIISKSNYYGNVLIDFEAQTVLPSTHDIDVMWTGSWDEETNTRATAYVAGIQGWWEGKVGIEKSPDYRFMAGTGLFEFQPGRTYLITAGSIEGHCFVLADGKLLIEAMDPDPIDTSRHGKVGFEAYCSWFRLRNVRVRQIVWEPVEMRYEPEW